MTTLDTLVGRTKRKLAGVTGRERMAALNGNHTDVTTTIVGTGASGTDVRAGALLSIGYELVDVISGTWPTVTVVRGVLETTAVAHTSGEAIEIEPRWPRGIVLSAIIDELRSWPRTLWYELATTIEFPAHTTTVNVDALDGFDAVRDQPLRATVINSQGSDLSTKRMTSATLLREMDTTEYPSGYALDISPLAFTTATDVRAIFALAYDFDTMASTTDLQTDCHVPASLEDVAIFGAGARLLADPENARLNTSAQGQPRDAAEIQPGSWLRAAQLWEARRDKRLAEEAARLLAKWGI